MLAQLALLDHRAFKESKAKQEPQDQLEQQGLAAQLVPQGLAVSKAMSAQLVQQDLAALLAL